MKFRLEIDTSKPILPGLFLRRIGKKPTWVYIKYVRLPNVCYNCGRLNHESRMCKERSKNREKQFGGWLKAEDPSVHNPVWSDGFTEESYLVVSPPATLDRGGHGVEEVERTDSMGIKVVSIGPGALENGVLESKVNEIIIKDGAKLENNETAGKGLENSVKIKDSSDRLWAYEVEPNNMEVESSLIECVVARKGELGRYIGPAKVFQRKPKQNSDTDKEWNVCRESNKGIKRGRKESGNGDVAIGPVVEHSQAGDVGGQEEGVDIGVGLVQFDYESELAETGCRSRRKP